MQRVVIGVLGFSLLSVTGAVASGAQSEAAATCAGHAVTISFDDPGVGTTITGTSGPDVIQGGPSTERINAGGGEDVVCGGSGGDIINGGAGRDELIGQDGSDTFRGVDLGQDVLTGGTGDFDTADYGQSTAAVEVNMTTHVVHATGAVANGGVLGIEAVDGTTFDDRLIGGPGRNHLNAEGGADFVDGRGGDDVLTGGPAIDRLSYANAASGINANVALNAVTVGDDVDVVGGFEVIEGSRFDDRFVSDEGNDHFIGDNGDDVLKGKAGDDILEGGGGDDTIFPGPGDDVVDGGANDPVTSSGEHGDLVSYQGDTLPPGVTFLDIGLYAFSPSSPPYASGIGEDELVGIESARGVKNGKTHVQGNDGPNVIIGGDGQDFLNARGGNDLVYGLGGVDILNGDYAAHSNDAIFGDDYLDGGAPTGGPPDGHGGGDGDSVHGNGGDDTCTGAVDDGDHLTECETVF